MIEYSKIDLLEIKDNLGDHWMRRERDRYRSSCEYCGEPVTQAQASCVVCGRPVIWLSSRAWKREHGSPTQFEDRLLSEPDDDVGKRLCRLAGVQRFPNPHTKNRWNSLRRKLSDRQLEGIISGCKNSLERRDQGMRGLIQFVLNAAELRARQIPQEVESDGHGPDVHTGHREHQDAPY